MNDKPTPKQQRLIWWVLWAAFQIGIVIIYNFLGHAHHSSPEELKPWQLGLLPALISGAIRWSLLPVFKDATKALPFFIVGIAMAEMSCFLGIFIFPPTKHNSSSPVSLGFFSSSRFTLAATSN